MNKIICISRQYGSGGRSIGRKLAQQLQVPFYDRDLITQAADLSGLPQDILQQVDERAANPYLHAFNYDSPHIVYRGKTVNDILYQAQRKAIRSMAQEGSCVIVGRCAAESLAESPEVRVLSVFLSAHTEDRVRCAMLRDNLDERHALAQLQKADRYRKDYHRYYAGTNWGQPENYDICLNTSRQDETKILKVLCNMVEAL